MNAPLTAEQWKRKVIQSRTYGATYIPVASRIGMDVEGVRYSWDWYGKSREGGGHKHKAYAHYIETGKPVLSRELPIK